jgi:hypothetical protein
MFTNGQGGMIMSLGVPGVYILVAGEYSFPANVFIFDIPLY